MRKSDFTIMVAKLILHIAYKGWYPLLDYAKRSRFEQKRLYDLGKSKCDGTRIISAHQYEDAGGRYAVDIYIHDGDYDINNAQLYKEAHEFWSSLGGDDMIEWDMAHFEAPKRKKGVQ